MGPLKVLNGTKLIINDQGIKLDSLTISLESFRCFRGPLLLKLVTGQELFFSISYNKLALAYKTSFVCFYPKKYTSSNYWINFLYLFCLLELVYFGKLTDFFLLPWQQPNGPKNSKDTRFIWVFIILGIFDFGQGSQLEGENLPSRPISSSSSLLHPYYSENFKKIPRCRSNPKTPCRNSVGQSPLTCSKKVIYLSFDGKIHYIKSSSFSSDI